MTVAGEPVPLLLIFSKAALKRELKSQPTSLAGSCRSLTSSIFIPRGVWSPAMSPGLSLAFGQASVTKKKLGEAGEVSQGGLWRN